MTVVTGAVSNYDATYLSALASATLGAHSGTQFVLTAGSFVITVTGTGLTYHNNGPNGGTITGITVQDNTPGTPITTTWSNFSVSAASLWGAVVSGNLTSFDNLLYGGNDTFASAASPGFPQVQGAFAGFAGNDTFNMQASNGPDFLSGGDGNDTFNYAGNFSGFTQIDGGAGTDTINLNGDYDAYTALGYVTNVELIHLAAGYDYNLAMTTATPVTIDGSALGAGDSLIFAGSGALTVKGGAGDDTIVIGSANEVFNAGGGSDTVDLSRATSAVTVDLTKSGAQTVGGGFGSETLNSVENVVGSNYNDTLTGNASDNLFVVGTGADKIDGGAGNDTVSFQNLSSGVTVDLRSGQQNIGGDTLTSIESVIGTPYGDTFIGNSADNKFDAGGDLTSTAPDLVNYKYATGAMTFTMTSYGGFGQNTIVATGGGQGTDTLTDFTTIVGTPFDDTYYLQTTIANFIDSGGGNDTISFRYASQSIFAGLGLNGVSENVEHVIGSAFGDEIHGDANNNILNGGGGNDTLDPETYGGGASGSDTLIGGGGIDKAVYYGQDYQYTITDNANGSITIKNAAGEVDTLWGIEQLAFGNRTITVSDTAVGAVRADFDGDANSDVLWQNSSGQVAIWTMNGLSQYDGSTIGANPGSAWHVKGAGDFDGDGMADILWQNDSGQAAVWTMNGFSQTGGAQIGGNPGASWHVVGAGDFDGDGKADILWQNTNGQVAIWTMDGLTQTGGGIVGGNPGPSWHAIAAADFNGDGKADILWQNDSGQAAIWLMDGLTQIGGGQVGGNPGSSWHVKGAGDFNGDGKADILWQNTSGQAAIWTMDGLTQTGGAQVGGNPGTTWHVEGAGDYNGDGFADILWQNASGQAAVWTMNGFTQLGGAQVGGNPGTAWHALAAGG